MEKGAPLLRAGFLPNEPGSWDYYWGIYWGNILYDARDGHFNIDTPQQRAAYEWYQSYPKKYPDVKILQSFQSGFGAFNSAQNAFIAGKVAMVVQGPYFAKFIELNNPAMVGHYGVGFVPLPEKLGLPAGSITLGDLDVWVVPKGARHKAEALERCGFLHSGRIWSGSVPATINPRRSWMSRKDFWNTTAIQACASSSRRCWLRKWFRCRRHRCGTRCSGS